MRLRLGDLGWGTAATEKGISGANRGSACRLGASSAGWRQISLDLRIARSQGASVFRTASVFRIFSGRLRCFGWHVASRGAAWEVSAARSVAGGLRPEDRFARRGVGLPVGVGKQFSLPRRVRENDCLDRFVGALRRVVRSVAARLQARQTECGAALQMFVAGLAASFNCSHSSVTVKRPLRVRITHRLISSPEVTLVLGIAVRGTYRPG